MNPLYPEIVPIRLRGRVSCRATGTVRRFSAVEPAGRATTTSRINQIIHQNSRVRSPPRRQDIPRT